MNKQNCLQPLLWLLLLTAAAEPAHAAPPPNVAAPTMSIEGLETQAERDRLFDAMERLRTAHGVQQGYAASALSELSLSREVRVRVFGELLNHPSRDVRSVAATVLKNEGDGARAALPLLLAMLRGDASPELAAQALGHVGAGSPDTVLGPLAAAMARGNRTAMQKGDGSLTAAAASALGTLRVRAPESQLGLLTVLRDGTVEEQYAAFMALGQILRANRETDFFYIREPWWQLPSDPAEASARLLTVGDRVHPNARVARNLAPALREIVESRPEPYVQMGALEILGSTGFGGDQGLVRTLFQLHEERRGGAAYQRLLITAIRTIGAGDEEMCGVVAEAMNSRDYATRMLALDVLQDMDEAASGAVPAIGARLNAGPALSSTELRNYLAVLTASRRPSAPAARALVQLLQQATLAGQASQEKDVPFLLAALCSTGAGPVQLDTRLRAQLDICIETALKNPSPFTIAAGARAAGVFWRSSPERAVRQLLPLVERPFSSMDMVMSGQLGGIYGTLQTLTRAQLAEDVPDGWRHAGTTTARIEAMRALAHMGAAAAPALPAIRKLYRLNRSVDLPIYPDTSRLSRLRTRQEARRALVLLKDLPTSEPPVKLDHESDIWPLTIKPR